MDETKLSLDWLRRLRFPQRDRAGNEYTYRKFHWRVNQTMPNGFEHVHWELKFDVQRWEWGFDVASMGGNDFDHSEYWTMWLHNYDPNRFLVGIEIHTQEDLTRFFDAFHLEYRVDLEANLEPLGYEIEGA